MKLFRKKNINNILNSDNYILGLSFNYHDSAAALLKNGVILGGSSEDRFTRIKGDSSFPIHAINFLLKSNNLEVKDINEVVFYDSPYLKFNRLLSTLMLGRVKSAPLFVKAVSTWIDSKLFVEKEIKKILGKRVKVTFVNHHISHGASAFYPSPFSDAMVLTVDGVGEWASTTIGYGNGKEYMIIEEITFPNSLGILYSAFTHYCGFKINSGEYKLMGLSPFGEERYVDVIKKELIHLDDDGSYSLNPEYFSFDKEERTYNKKFISLFGSEPRREGEEVREIDQDLARSIQVVLNEALLNLAKRCKGYNKSKNLVMAGGVALNVVSIGFIERSGLFDNIWVQPASGDAGGSLGASLYRYYSENDRVISLNDSMSGAFLGALPSYERNVEDVINDYGLKFTEVADSELVDRISSLILQGNIIGVCKGRAEFGPRALGNRSIIADARINDMQVKINMKTKFREGFRPFAPMMLERNMEKLLINPTPSPYMLKTFYFKDEYRYKVNDDRSNTVNERVKAIRSKYPAVTHLDYSCRVQSIDPLRNKFYYDLLVELEKREGVELLLNTSFNVRGEPIINSAEDAVEGFLSMEIDYLLLENKLISKVDNSEVKPRRERKFAGD